MGSPSAELNVLESLRPWYQNGLSFIYKDALPGLAQIEQTVKQKNINTASGPQTSTLQTPQNLPQANINHGTQPSPVSRAVATPMPSHLKQSTPPLKPSRIPPKPVKEPAQPLCRPDAGSWPDPWCQLASRITNRLQIFWTYPQLGQDLSGDADPARRKLFQSLIGYMGLPKGAISFWPCTSWNGAALENRPDIFWKGVEAYGVKFVACFGSQGLSVIAPDAPAGSSSAYVNGIQVIVLQDPDLLKVLPADEQQLLSIALLRLPLF